MSALKVISLGWGLQSTVLAFMAALGELEPVDFAIHSDTTWERSATYEYARQWTPFLEERGVKVVTVSDAEQAAKAMGAETDMPAFTVSVENGVHGQLRRQCTNRWKITPMRRYISQELERRGLTKQPGTVEQWLGITLDEIQRAKDSDVQYITHRFPLLELGMRRSDCLDWLNERGLPSPGKSACVQCPYHNKKTWQQMKREGGADWERALMIDTAIRDKRPPYPLFVHSARKPLEEAVVIPEDYGTTQLELLAADDWDAECDSGACFL